MKRVLVLGMTNIIGGIETYIYNLVMHSQKEKIQYYFWVKFGERSVFQDEITAFYEGENHFYFPPMMKSNPIKTYKYLKNFFDLYDNWFDVIYVNSCVSSDIIYIAPFIHKIKAKIIYHSHSTSFPIKGQNELFRPLLNRLVTQRIACGKDAAKWMYGKKAESALIINNGINVKKFLFSDENRNKIRQTYGIKNDDVLIGHVGRMSSEKNHIFLINLMEEILKYNKKYKLICVGDGNLYSELTNLVKEKKMENYVFFVGKQMLVENYYSAFDIFVMPSIYEGLPITGIEAQAAGLKCIFSKGIDSDVIISDKAKLVSLSEPVENWLKEILNYKEENILERKKYVNVIMNSGYDISQISKKMTDIIYKL